MHRTNSRRRFLSTAAGLAAASALPYWFCRSAAPAAMHYKAKNDRPLIGAIGVGGQGTGILRWASQFGDVVAVCDADRDHAERARALFGGKPAVYQDYRKLLERKDVEVITNGTPDHWHAGVVVAACQAGKDVYTEKPLSLTIDEGKRMREVVRQTGRIVQVGTQQRSDPNFRLACDLVRSGRLDKLKSVTVTLPFFNTKGGRNGIMFTGTGGRVSVNRGGIHGKPVDELKSNPLPETRTRLYTSDNHMGNFFECVKSRKEPIAPVRIAHRVITACHLTNIAVRLGRRITWDAAKEQIVGNAEAEASKYVCRPRRKPYELT